MADHPMAAKLFKEFKPGSKIMTKPRAYEIGNELNRLQAKVEELEQALHEAHTDLMMSGGSQ